MANHKQYHFIMYILFVVCFFFLFAFITLLDAGARVQC